MHVRVYVALVMRAHASSCTHKTNRKIAGGPDDCGGLQSSFQETQPTLKNFKFNARRQSVGDHYDVEGRA